jgi:hypothetical protein
LKILPPRWLDVDKRFVARAAVHRRLAVGICYAVHGVDVDWNATRLMGVTVSIESVKALFVVAKLVEIIELR